MDGMKAQQRLPKGQTVKTGSLRRRQLTRSAQFVQIRKAPVNSSVRRFSNVNLGTPMKILNLIAAIVATLLVLSRPVQAADPSDTRHAIVLTPAEYSWLLNEMRGHLDAIGAAQLALSTGDVEAARQAMLERGTARLKTPGRLNLSQKTPDAWKAMATEMHQSFDAVAHGLGNKESAPQIMGRVAKVMQYCTGCHASYRLTETP